MQNYSGDFGDLASFATHMRAMAEDKGVDLLLVCVEHLHLTAAADWTAMQAITMMGQASSPPPGKGPSGPRRSSRSCRTTS